MPIQPVYFLDISTYRSLKLLNFNVENLTDFKLNTEAALTGHTFLKYSKAPCRKSEKSVLSGI